MADVSVDTAIAIRELQAELALKYGLDFQQRSFWISGSIDDKMLKHVEGCMSLLENDSGKTITVRINSGGGSEYPALAIVSRLLSSKCKVKTEGHGHIMSAATLILACGHKRSISKLATFMWHESSYLIGGRHTESKAWADQMQVEEQKWADTMASFTKQDSAFWLEAGQHTDKFYTAAELLIMGVVDKTF